jgi:hypothetical protein
MFMGLEGRNTKKRYHQLQCRNEQTAALRYMRHAIRSVRLLPLSHQLGMVLEQHRPF